MADRGIRGGGRGGRNNPRNYRGTGGGGRGGRGGGGGYGREWREPANRREGRHPAENRPQQPQQHRPSSTATNRERYWSGDDIAQIARLSSADLVQRIQQEQGAFTNAFEYNRNYERNFTLYKLIRILSSLCNSQEVDFSGRMVSQIFSSCSGFLMKLREVVMTTDDSSCLHQIVNICKFCTDKIPQTTLYKLPHAELKEAIEQLDETQNRSLIRLFEDYSKQHDMKKEEMKKILREKQQRPLSNDRRYFNSDDLQNLHDLQPPNNFREIEILPSAEEFKHKAEKPFLRPAIIDRSYHNWDHYLDVQFRLLREDFMSPLRDGINEFLTGNEKNRNVHLYFDVRVQGPVCLYTGIGFNIQFDVHKSRLNHVRWEHSRRLIYGSLLCLSHNNFRTLMFASVVTRDPEKLSSGCLAVKFEGNVNGFAIDPSQNFTMVESTAYFEAYRHVLEGLQQIKVDQMPFTSYIIAAYDKNPIPLPLCIQRNPVFDLNRVLKLKRPIAPINVQKWPSHLQNDVLDDSQEYAFKMALSQQISVIQGPPGTGKTYVGLKIIEALLQNRTVWDPMSNSPILVVCYTNHALDQFLDGIFDVPIAGARKPSIVRVGGRCKSEKLKDCAMANLVRQMKKNREVPGNVYREVRSSRDTMKALADKMNQHLQNIDAMEGKILTVEEIEGVMEGRHHQQIFYGLPNVPEHRHMEVWLDLWLLPAFDYDNEQENEMDEDEQLAAALDASLRIGRPGAGTQPPNTGMGLEGEPQQAGGLVIEGSNDEAGNNVTDLRQGNNNDQANLIDVIDEPQILQEERMMEGDIIELGHNATAQQQQQPAETKQTNEKVTKKGGWEVKQLTAKDRKKRIERGMKHQPMNERQARNVVDVWRLSMKEKWQLYQYWLNEYIRQSKAQLRNFGDHYDRNAQLCIEIDHELNKLTLAKADIVGMTTTGAAKHSYILKHFHPKIVIVEEAAEVMESHVITSLCASVEQLVLIGDHKQLQPKITCYDLEKYHLHVSLFERLALKQFPIATLAVQHRMRPEIATIVANHIYDGKLEDHHSVKNYDHVKGIGKDLFFIEHCQPEKPNPTGDQRSHANPFEADYVTALTKHLLKQGYSPHEITILTMYRGQLFEIKQRMRRDEFGGVRVTAVDDFQGEENEVVIISLVRSNNEGSIGFLKVANRICVSLSRAKKGMYVIGNFAMLRDKKDTKWPAILDQMEREGYLGDGLPLCCQIHSEEKIMAKDPSDFSKSPEGGCRKQCNTRLDCGHVCKSPCHPLDREHKGLYCCQQKCDKKLRCGHKCSRRCYECIAEEGGCPPCEVNVSRTLATCGHDVRMKCSEEVSTFKCNRRCDRLISKCGHRCQNRCSEPCTQVNVCQELVKLKLSCGHMIKVPCSADQSSIVCQEPCGKRIESCNHKCQGTCGSCSQGRLHVQCKHKCGKSLNCGHICDFPCPEYCPPCAKLCRNHCFHSKCPKKCYEPCVPCREPCKWKCEHYKCTALCGEMCNRPPCDRPCRKLLQKCGHPCIGLCGEDCPDMCRICNKDEVTEVFFGTEDEKDARFIQLKDCGHVFEVSSMDQWMETQKESESHIIKFIECPKCKTPIRRSLRYGNVIKSTINEMEQVKLRNMENGVTTSPQELLKRARDTVSAVSSSVVKPACKDLCSRIDTAIAATDKLKGKAPPFLPHQLNTIENQINLFPKLAKLFECLHKIKINTKRCQFTVQVVHITVLDNEAMKLMDFLKAEYLTPQQLKDAECEMRRLFCLSRICEMKHNAYKENRKISMEDEMILETHANRYISSGVKERNKATPEEQTETDQMLEAIRNKYSIGGLSASERMEIVKAMSDIQKGAWYKCPNGHIYAIGECGGANQVGTCPECRACIGGTGHQLASGNVVASEMDGARHAAWSEGANLANFDPQQLNALFH